MSWAVPYVPAGTPTTTVEAVPGATADLVRAKELWRGSDTSPPAPPRVREDSVPRRSNSPGADGAATVIRIRTRPVGDVRWVSQRAVADRITRPPSSAARVGRLLLGAHPKAELTTASNHGRRNSARRCPGT